MHSVAEYLPIECQSKFDCLHKEFVYFLSKLANNFFIYSFFLIVWGFQICWLCKIPCLNRVFCFFVLKFDTLLPVWAVLPPFVRYLVLLSKECWIFAYSLRGLIALDGCVDILCHRLTAVWISQPVFVSVKSYICVEYIISEHAHLDRSGRIRMRCLDQQNTRPSWRRDPSWY